MKPGTDEASSLDAQPVLQLQGAHGCRIRCVAGTAWVTQDGRCVDIVLEPGAEHLVQGRAPVVVSGLPCCELHLRRAAAEPESVSLGCARHPTSCRACR